MSKRQDIEIIRREIKVSFKEARRIYKANGESLLNSLYPIPPRAVNISSFTRVILEAVNIYPRYIDDKVIKEDLYPWSPKDINKITYRGYLRILREEGGYYENGEIY